MLASVVGGLVGGLIGAGVMSAGHALIINTIAGDRASQPANEEHDEDATVKVADRIALAVRGQPLAESEKSAAANVVHYSFGAAMGALYGGAAAVSPAVSIGAGAGFGIAVWLGAHAIVVPALGLARSPLRAPPGKEVPELILHLAYGVTVGLVQKLALRISR